ncbi:uncharacterized protein M421DRAFT_95808 [Didymella exigua CBS 183.55]|uniref:DUF6604 domain-containing protein n=1 Tax=Didymella exigua CBS 183.55 TaxID=1150837 RepID=A0A6A5R9C2_9PLEO|nr:uncharacterized protein M421DRAFT_95808 [Didymella exigua CBS 183.55]KAF1923850.1 hypothetical protein M421DRAFT_95808 [Didymella exigua CBS 183.55]
MRHHNSYETAVVGCQQCMHAYSERAWARLSPREQMPKKRRSQILGHITAFDHIYAINIYESIKRATESTISWLVETALDRGCNVQLLPDSEPRAPHAKPPKKSQLKEKVRKEAKDAAKPAAKVAGPMSQSASPRIVSEQEIIRLASLLQEQQEELVVPKRFLTDMRRAFLGRRLFADKYSREEPDSPGNAPHAHFAEVLGKLVGVLEPLLCVKSASGVIEAANVDVGAKFLDSFDVLALPNNEQEKNDGAPGDAAFVADAAKSAPTSSLDPPPVLYSTEVNDAEELQLQDIRQRGYKLCPQHLVPVLRKPWISSGSCCGNTGHRNCLGQA